MEVLLSVGAQRQAWSAVSPAAGPVLCRRSSGRSPGATRGSRELDAERVALKGHAWNGTHLLPWYPCPAGPESTKISAFAQLPEMGTSVGTRRSGYINWESCACTSVPLVASRSATSTAKRPPSRDVTCPPASVTSSAPAAMSHGLSVVEKKPSSRPLAT